MKNINQRDKQMKDLKIRKELFEAVYNCDISTDKDMFGMYKSINIYEFAFMCKEWAKSKDYYILSGYDDTNIPVSLINHHYGEGGCSCDEYFEVNTEPEAIFKACEWILKHKENQCTE